MPNKYAGIPISILKNKAEFGTHIHEAIELYEKGLDFELTEMEQLVFNQYLKMKEKYSIEPIEQEKIVGFEQHFCGRLDMIAFVNGKKSLIDIKTTAKLDIESLSWQLGFYNFGHKYIYDEDFEDCYCLWLPKKDVAQLIKIEPKIEEEILDAIKKFEEVE